jgi:polyphosphate glucokinase
MLFLGLGTGLGTAMIVDGMVEPMELGHLPYKKSTYEDYVGRAGLERNGRKKWRHHVADTVERLIAALRPDETVIGGGNVAKLYAIPLGCRAGQNANAFRGGFRLWLKDDVVQQDQPAGRRRGKQKTRLISFDFCSSMRACVPAEALCIPRCLQCGPDPGRAVSKQSCALCREAFRSQTD